MGSRDAAEFASLESVAPREVETGEPITLTGSGFVVGPAVVVLDGTLSAPGTAAASRTFRVALDALATTPTTATAEVARRHFDRYRAEHMTFAGRCTIRFPSRAGPDAPAVSASVDSVRLELFSSANGHGGLANGKKQAGRAVLSRLGLVAAATPAEGGLVVESVRPGSLAARARLRPHDLIVAAGDLTVAGIADLAPPPGARRIELAVRSAEGSVRRVAFPLERDDDFADRERIAALSIAAVALLVMLAMAGPLRSPVALLARAVARPHVGISGQLGRFLRGAGTAPAAICFAILLFAAAPFVVMAMARSNVVLVAGLAGLASIAAAGSAASGWRRLAAGLCGGLGFLPLAMALGLGVVRGEAMDLGGIVSAQGSFPWQWECLSSPTSLLLLLLVSIGLSAGEARAPGPLEAFSRGLGAALAATVFLGGWSAPPGQALAGQVLFAAKAWALGLCLPVAARVRWPVLLPLAATAAAGSIAFSLVPLPAWATVGAEWSASALALFVVAPRALSWLVTAARASVLAATGRPELGPEAAPHAGLDSEARNASAGRPVQPVARSAPWREVREVQVALSEPR